MKKKSREWKVRLNEEIKSNKTGKFVTLTFSNKSLLKLKSITEYSSETEFDNDVATKAVRLFLERWRKKYKKSLRHWLITELGHTGTERIHLHGIVFTNEIEELKKIWSYGWVYVGTYLNEQTINYIAKYVTKIDTDHKWFTGKILTSAGIGSDYINSPQSKLNKYKNEMTNELYQTRKGTKLPIPIYYRNKIYSEEERNQLWINKLNENTRFVMGEKIDVSTNEGEAKYWECVNFYRSKNIKLGYGSINWNKDIYEKSLKKLKDLKPS